MIFTTRANLEVKITSSKLSLLTMVSIIGSLCVFGLSAEAQPMYQEGKGLLLQDFLKKHSHEVPPKSTKIRIKKYDNYIRYFTSLSFFQQGVKVNANFLRALMSAESAGNPYAVSDKNAIGLTQITPETGRIAARELYQMNFDFEHIDEEKLKNLQPSDLFDPAINILICCYLLDKYNYEYKGNIALTVSAWNAGPGAVRQYRGYPPYEETLTLIARVNTYFLHYQRLYWN